MRTMHGILEMLDGTEPGWTLGSTASLLNHKQSSTKARIRPR